MMNQQLGQIGKSRVFHRAEVDSTAAKVSTCKAGALWHRIGAAGRDRSFAGKPADRLHSSHTFERGASGMKTALSIAGSDSSGGAGIQADLKTFSVLGVFGTTALTAVTAQNTTGVKASVQLEADIVRRQIDAVAGDIQIDATKSGMLGSRAVIEVVEECLLRNKLQPYVLDPVMVTKSGDPLLKEDAVAAMVKLLFPLATIVTPNLRETAELTDVERMDPSVATARDAARRIVDRGARSVIIKGIEHADQMVDLFFDGREFLEFSAGTQPKEKTHGSGCAFSAAIAAGLANRLSLVDAIDQAKQLVTMAIQYGDGQGRGTTPINVLSFAPKVKK
jgi:hydroxymethylpyrimidine/phosphomethylpyrimidine kinase